MVKGKLLFKKNPRKLSLFKIQMLLSQFKRSHKLKKTSPWLKLLIKEKASHRDKSLSKTRQNYNNNRLSD